MKRTPPFLFSANAYSYNSFLCAADLKSDNCYPQGTDQTNEGKYTVRGATV